MGKNRESNEGNTSISKSIGNILVQNADLLDLPGWTVREGRNTDEHLLIEAESEEVPLSCPLCESTRPPYHFGRSPRLVADLLLRGDNESGTTDEESLATPSRRRCEWNVDRPK